MTDHERKLRLTPALGEGVDVGTTYTAVGDRELDIFRLECLRLELHHLEVRPLGGIYIARLMLVIDASFVMKDLPVRA